MIDTNSTTLGFIGLGLMGTAMTRRLLDRGWRVAVWNREPENIPPVVAAGAIACASPAEVTALSDVVMLSVYDHNAVRECIFRPDGVASRAAAHKLVIDHSTTHPAATREIAERLARDSGMRWVDAPVSGGPGAAREGALAIMAGGLVDDIEAVRPVLLDLAGSFSHVGPVGAGQTVKIINQALVGTTCVLMAEAVALAEAAGIAADRIPSILAGGNADSTLLRKFYPRMASRQFEPRFGYARGLFKDLQTVSEFGKELALDLALINCAAGRFADYVGRGNAMADVTSIVRLYDKNSEPT